MLPSFIIHLVNLVRFSYDLQKLYHWYASCAVLETVHSHPQSQVEPSPLRQFGQMWVARLQHPSGLLLPWSLLPYFQKILFTTSMIMLILNFYGGFKLWTKTCRRLPRWHLDLSSHSWRRVITLLRLLGSVWYLFLQTTNSKLNCAEWW